MFRRKRKVRIQIRKLFIYFLVLIILSNGCLAFAGGVKDTGEAGTEDTDIIVPILMYHQLKLTNPGKDSIMPYEFENDLKYLKENNFTTITMTDLIDYVLNYKELPEKPIILSFDDGYYNNYVYVYPLLKKYDMKIVLSLIGKDTDDFSKVPSDNISLSHVTWDQVNEMMESGLVEIQNHSYNMHKITSKRYGCLKKRAETQDHYERELTEDILKLQIEATVMTGFTPNTFNYPYGRVSEESYPIIKKLGFQASLTCNYGVNIIDRDPECLYNLRRVCRSHNQSAKKMLKEAMETLKYRKKK